MQNNTQKITALRGLREVKPQSQSQISTLFTVNTEVQKKSVARVSFLLSKNHDAKLKVYCAQYGKKLKRLVEESLREFFDSGAAKGLSNPYANDGSGTVQKGVSISVELKEQLDRYVEREAVSMRFVVESLLSQYTVDESVLTLSDDFDDPFQL